MCYQVRFITRSVKCIVTMWWVMAWLGNGFGCSMKDERTCTMRREVGVHLWWMMIWCVRSTKEHVTTDISQFGAKWFSPLPTPKEVPGRKRFDDDDDLRDAVQKRLTSQAAAFYERVYKNLCPVTINAPIMAANMWKNSMKNVESGNYKILYETLVNFFFQQNGTYFLNRPRIMLPRLGSSDSPQYLPYRYLFSVMYDNINIYWWVCLLLIYHSISNSMYIPICKTLKHKETSKIKFQKPWFDIQHRQDNYLFSRALRLALGSSQLPGDKAASVRLVTHLHQFEIRNAGSYTSTPHMPSIHAQSQCYLNVCSYYI